MAIPTSTHVVESAVIDASLAKVWSHIKLGEFSNWWTALKGSAAATGTNEATDCFTWTFKDGTVLEVKQEGHSSIEHSIVYSVITATPALSYSSVLSTIRCYAVTSGPAEGSTYIEWSASFSSDADAGVIEDARFKRKEALADLAKSAVSSK